MRSRTSGGLLKFSVALTDARVDEIDAVALDLTPPESAKPISRGFATDYLIGLGLEVHRKRKLVRAATDAAMEALAEAS